MIVVIGYYSGDRDLAVKLLDWMAELGQYPNHDLLFVRDHRTEPIVPPAILKSTQEILVAHDSFNVWPISANLMFQAAALYIESKIKQPWLWLEPDAVLIKATGLDDIEAEYKSCGKPFMGDRVEVNDVPVHMSGVGVYPARLSWNAGTALLAKEIAWDVYAAPQIVPKMHHTKLIEHAWKHPKFESLDQVKREIAPETVLYHSSKDGSLIDRLRENREVAGLSSDKTLPVMEASVARDGSNPSSRPFCDIFIKTYPPDYEWLTYCISSIDKFCSGFRQVMIVIPHDSIIDLQNRPRSRVPIIFRTSKEEPDGYLGQQVEKLNADHRTDADYFLHLDSDTIFTKPVTPETFFKFGKPVWMMTPWAQTQTPWQPIIEKFLKRPVAFEFMRRAPQCIPRWLYADLRAFCEREHGMSMEAYVMSQPLRSFSEFNALGAFAYEFHPDKFCWINTSTTPEKEWPELVVDQRWSKGGLTPEIRSEWDKILDGGAQTRTAEHQPARGVMQNYNDPSRPSNNSKDEHIAALKRCFTSPLAKARVIRALKAAPILKHD